MNLTSHEIAQKLESIPAGNRGISRRKPIYGAGVNDVNFITQTNVNGVAIVHPGYLCWRGMLARCYSDKYKRKNKTYTGVSVCDDWLSLSKFLEWWKLNRVDGWHLGRVRISTLHNETEKISLLNSNTYKGAFLCLVTYSHLPWIARLYGGNSQLGFTT